MDYESTEFLTDGSVSRTYDELNYHDKIKVRALQGLDQLAASLNAISNIKAIEFQLNHLNEMSDGFEAQLAEKDAQIAKITADKAVEIAALHGQIAALTSQLTTIEETQAEQLLEMQNSQAASKALLEAQIASLQAANESLTDNFNKFRAVVASIDELTDEVID